MTWRYPDIKPTGLSMKHEVDLWYQLFNSFFTLVTQLDGDGQVNDATHVALCWTALMNGVIRDSKGNRIGQQAAEENFYEIAPTGITDAARLQLLYNYFNMWETLCEQLDNNAGGVAGTDYEELCFTDIFLHNVENTKGNTLGNGVVFYFRPGGLDKTELVECYFNMVNGLSIFTTKLDADGTVTDTTYVALCFTATLLTRIENGASSQIANKAAGLGGL